MEDRENLSYEEVMEISKTFPWEPSFNKVYITLNREEFDGELVLSDNTMAEVQYIVAKGPNVHWFEVGDEVLIDLDKMTVRERNPEDQYEEIERVKFDPVYEGLQVYALIEDRLIKSRKKRV